MDVTECIQTRRTIRKYSNKEVEWDKIATILDAGRLAPSAGNLQNWKFISVDDPEKKQALAAASLQQDWIAEAHTLIIIIAEPLKAERYYGLRGERLYTIQNCAAAAENMILQAHSLGLGTAWIGAFEEESVKRTLGLPDEVRPQIILTIGYAAETVEKPAKFPLESITYLNSWHNKIKDVAKYIGWHSVALERNINKAKQGSLSLAERAIETTKDIIKNIKNKIKKQDKEQFDNIHN